MRDRRLLLRVVLKLMISFALLILLLVFANSFTPLFKSKQTKPVATAFVDMSNMHVNEIRKIRWQGKDVAVLYRGTQNASERTTPYFVYINIGDSGSCPLKFSNNQLTDICTATRFDLSGRNLDNSQTDKGLSTPPYHIENNQIIIGQWK